MERILGRPGRLLMPAAIGLCAIFADWKAASALAMAVISARILSLCAGAALRLAATRIVSGPRLTGNYYLSLIIGVLGAGLTMLLWTLPISPLCGRISAETAMAGCLIMLAQLAADGLYSIPDNISGNACDALIAIYTAAGLLISGGSEILLIAACGICVVAAVALSLALRRGLGFSSGAKIIPCIPVSMLRTGIPSLGAAAAIYSKPEYTGIYLIFWAIYEAMEAPIRRGREEGEWVNVLCAAITAVSAAAMFVISGQAGVNIACSGFAAVAAMIIFLSPVGIRQSLIFFISAALLFAAGNFSSSIAAGLENPYIFHAVAAAAAAGAIAAVIPDIRAIARKMRAQRLMRKRIRNI